MQKCALVLAFLLAGSLSASHSAAAPGVLGFDAKVAVASGEFTVPASRRCVPSSCECRGSRTIICTMDCRSDLRCWCARGKYICRNARR
jgi:hypothetical protein